MNCNEIWKSKETSSYLIKIIGPNPDGSVQVAFGFGFSPRIHNYEKWYIEKYYEYAGYESIWVLGKGFSVLPKPIVAEPITEPEVTPEPKVEPKIDHFEALDPEKVLFGDYTGEEKINTWKEV